jgi:hypothetical protein
MVLSKDFWGATLCSFYFDVQSCGSSVPSSFNRNKHSLKRYSLRKNDIFTSSFWQKAQAGFVLNQDEESLKKFKKKYSF